MRQHGVTLIELAIGVAIFGILMAFAVPNITAWLNNSQIRTASDSLLAGLQLARSEAVGRNAFVRFQLTDSLTGSCALLTPGTAATGASWVVSLADPTSKCDIAPSAATAPQTIQNNNGAVGTPRAEITTTGASVVYFNGFGRVSTTVAGAAVTNISQIDISNTTGGACQTSANTSLPMRCLRVMVTSGGNVKLCDPAVSVATDPRYC